MSRPLLAHILLKPLSQLYGAVTWVRNRMFDWGILPQREFDIPIIVVGNLAAGGTGKTPHVEYIVNLLSATGRVGVLSRGYKRATKGFVLATPQSTPRDIGDESYQIYQKFGNRVMVVVCESRVKGIERMLEIDPKLDVIVMDDAFQHRHVKPGISVVLTEYDRPIFKDSMLPYGRLRESRSGILRADIVIASKCPSGLKPLDFNLFDKYMNLYPSQQMFYSRFRYGKLRPLFPDEAVETPRLSDLSDTDMLLAVCGIGNPRPFVRHLKSFRPRTKVNIFPDHHNYTRKDADLLVMRFNSMRTDRKYIITTEKDAVRLINSPYFPHELKPYIFFLPVRVDFIDRNSATTLPGVYNTARPDRQRPADANLTFDKTLKQLLAQRQNARR